MANRPKLLLADEPTGSVDSKTANTVLDLFSELNKALGITIVIVTHDSQISKKVDRVVAISDGRTSSELIRKASYVEVLATISNAAGEETHIEYAVMDKNGRIQIPQEYIKSIGLAGKNKVRVELESGKIVLLNPDK